MFLEGNYYLNMTLFLYLCLEFGLLSSVIILDFISEVILYFVSP